MNRLNSFRAEMKCDAAFITNEPDVKWLTGFTGDSSSVLITETAAYFLTDSRYTEQAEKQCSGFSIIDVKPGRLTAVLSELLSEKKRLGIDFGHTTVSEMNALNALKLSFTDISEIPRLLRSIKSADELERMREGARLTEDTFKHILGYIKEGVSELDLYSEMVYFFHKHGAEPSFTPIIASGENSSMPHAVVTERRLKKGDFITMDFGVRYKEICTDFTRTVALFGVEEEQIMVYNTVKYAQLACVSSLKPGLTGRQADALARDIINAAGYGENFGHGTGHGVGVEIHEAPRLSVTSDDILSEGMVVTVEPGIYLPGRMGVRIEDMAVITKDGCENFYTADKELIII